MGRGERKARNQAYLQRKINRKPRCHIPTLPLRMQRMRRQLDIAVQHRLEIPSETVHAAAVRGRECEACGAGIVFIVAYYVGVWFWCVGLGGRDVVVPVV